MKKTILMIAMAMPILACTDTQKQLQQRASELCSHIPNPERLEQSGDYLTADFYNILDTLFNRLPAHEAMDHEWNYFFVTGNGGVISDFEVIKVEKTDPGHATATISVRQIWEDGSFDPATDIEEHVLYMEKINGQWLMSDFDLHKADCQRHIAISRDEQAKRQAISNYLVNEIGIHYLQGKLCIPSLMIVREEDNLVWGDFWVFWYNISGDTLKCVSGGNHSGLITLQKNIGSYTVTSFEQTVDGAGNDASARRIFGDYYDIYQNMHSNQNVREAVRREQLSEYLKAHDLHYRYYQDYGWPVVSIAD